MSSSARRVELSEPKSRSCPTRVRGGRSGQRSASASPPSRRRTIPRSVAASISRFASSTSGVASAVAVTSGNGIDCRVAAMALDAREESVCEAIDSARDELVALASSLVAFDTTARNPGDPPREEAPLQEFLAARLEAAGAEADVFEPDARALEGKPLVPPGLDFVGRPELIATKA